MEDAATGIAGLVVLGSAWESVDVFNALSAALQADGASSLALAASLRIQELAQGGGKSQLAWAPAGENLAAIAHRGALVQDKDAVRRAFKKLRAAAEKHHGMRTLFMSRRLSEGRHPDTDSEFWRGFTEAPRPKLPGGGVFAPLRRSLGL